VQILEHARHDVAPPGFTARPRLFHPDKGQVGVE
jgi:hypothetical protein